MGFRPFTEHRSSLRNFLTLRVSGAVFISGHILNKIHGHEPAAVCLFVDEENLLVGLKFMDVYDGAIKECRKVLKEKSGVSVSIQPILRFFDIPKLTKKVDLAVKEEEKMLILDLKALRSENT